MKLCAPQKLTVAEVEKRLFERVGRFRKGSQVDLQLRGRGTGRVLANPVKLRSRRNIQVGRDPSIAIAENADKHVTLGHFG